MVEIISNIQSVEATAEEIKKSAKVKAKQIKEAAILSGKNLMESEGKNALAQASGMISHAVQKAEDSVAEFANQSSQICLELKAQANLKMDKAAVFIVERIVDNL